MLVKLFLNILIGRFYMKKFLFALIFYSFEFLPSDQNFTKNRKVKLFMEELVMYQSLKNEGKVHTDINDKSWYELSNLLKNIWKNSKISQEDKEKCDDLFNQVMDIKD
jgi:hypothetical protein